MLTARRAAIAALPALLVFGLTGCSLLVAKDADSTPTGVAACALGHTWELDTADLATQVLATLKRTVPTASDVKVDGTQSMAWDANGDIKITTDYTLTATVTPAADQVTTATQTHKGTASGKAYINAEVAIPRNWVDSDFTVTTKYVINGVEKAEKDPDPFVIEKTDFDDSVGVELTCDGTKLTTHPRGTQLTQTWSRKG